MTSEESTRRGELLKSGVEGLDTVLNGGFRLGAAYILNGPPGAGKTILANQLCFNAARQGYRALYISLLAESHDRMIEHMRKMEFYSADAIPHSLFYASAFNVLQKDGLDGLLRMINAEIRRHQADIAVLDGLFVVHDIAGNEQEFRRFVHELQGLSAMTNCMALLLTNQARKPSAPEHTMVDGWIELLDEMHHARAIRIMVIRKHRGRSFLRGRHQYRITDRGIAIYPRVEAFLSREPAPSRDVGRISSGIPQLDTMMAGGYPAASATVLLGPTGVGKTTVGLQFLSASTPEEPGLLFGFFETPERLRIKAQSIGLDFDGLIANGALEILWQSPAENLPDQLAYELLGAVERRRAKRIFVDGIGAWKEAFQIPERLPTFFDAVNNTLKCHGATSIYTMEMRELFFPESLHTDDFSAMVDNVVLLHYARRDDLTQRKLSILKIRDSDFDAFAEEFTVTAAGIRFGQGPSQRRRPSAVNKSSNRSGRRSGAARKER